MKISNFVILSIVILVSLTSCYESDDYNDNYYIHFKLDGVYWNLNENNGSFDSFTSLISEDIWECEWRNDDDSLFFRLECEPAPDSTYAEDGYECYIYLTDRINDNRYHSIDGFSIDAVYNKKHYDYRGTFSGPGEMVHAEVGESVFFSEGKFILEHNTIFDFDLL